MKYIVLILLTLSIANAGAWSVMTSMSMKKVKPDAIYKLNTSGWAPRVYEFTTKTQPYMKCVTVFSSSDKSSAPMMHCIKK